ncbi:MAR-binding filament-like protein 1-1 [Heracleum sosnowskyi]|uniref:MAR-binding filament-like protein 1-1 n=1 Tax=Heracleum sosnowskyi TaxID=360622 RepID=A0AAD8M5I7_9APIA|nr:MAR-binding filament-like protein 1-1 [Heracleum sosnowskyi]
MSFAMGSSLNSPIFYSLYPISTQPFSSHSKFLNFSKRNAGKKGRNVSVVACLQVGEQNDGDLFKKRAILFMGISILPLLKFRSEAEAAEDSITLTPEQKQNAKQSNQGNASPNPFLSLLNGIGIFGSSVFGVLYALAQKEKDGTEATMESMKTKLDEKEVAMISLQQKFESQLRDEREERNKQVKMTNEEKQSLINQLQLANSTITGLGQELTKEKRVVEGFKVQIDSLTTSLAEAEQNNEDLENELKEKLNFVEILQEKINLLTVEINDKEADIRDLSCKLDAKESDFSKLTSVYENTKNEVVGLYSQIRALKDDLTKVENELELKFATIDDLNAEVSSLIAERDEANRKLGVIAKEYDDLKSSSEKKAISDARLLEDRMNELHQLKEQLKLALDEVSKKKVLVTDLSHERDDLKRDLDRELKAINNLEQELILAQEALDKSRNEAFDQAKQLEQSRNLCSQLNLEVSNIQTKSAEAIELLQRNLAEAKQSEEALTTELTSKNEILKQAKEQIETMSNEMTVAVQNCESLQKELDDVYRKAESAVRELEEEKGVITSLNKELRNLESQILKDKEARVSLETDLEEATRSLDEMNRNALILSKDLELANSKISSLQDEKDVYYRSLTEQKQISQEAKENMEDAHKLVMKLGKEREKFEKKSQKLEEAAASAKGEILRLRSQISSSKASINNVDNSKAVMEEKKVKKNSNVDSQKANSVDNQKAVKEEKKNSNADSQKGSEEETKTPVKRTRRRKVVSKKES